MARRHGTRHGPHRAVSRLFFSFARPLPFPVISLFYLTRRGPSREEKPMQMHKRFRLIFSFFLLKTTERQTRSAP